MNKLPSSTRHAFIASLALIALSAAPSFGVTYTWDGGGGNSNWSTGTNWNADITTYANGDTYIIGQGLSNTTFSTSVDAAFTNTVGGLQLWSNNNVTQTMTLNTASGVFDVTTAGTGIAYNNSNGNSSVLTNPAAITLDLNGNEFRNSGNSATITRTFLGTVKFSANNSKITVTNQSQVNTINFGKAGSPTVVQVTGDSLVGRMNTSAAGGSVNPLNIGVLDSASTLDVSNNATLRLVNQVRVTSAGAQANLNVSNAGTITVSSGATITAEKLNFNNGSQTSSAITITNNAGANLVHGGTVKLLPDATGTATINNAGKWKITGGSAALLDDRAVANTNAISVSNQVGGILTGGGANDNLEYNSTNHASGASDRLTINNQGIITPGDGTGGSGLASVGSLTLRDSNLTFSGTSDTLRIDIGGTSGGQFDTLSLAAGASNSLGAGTLTLDTSKLELFYVNGFNPSSSFSIDILNYGASSGSFDLSGLTITGASGAAADITNYSITYGATAATLNFTAIPEPKGTLFLMLGGIIATLMNFRRRRAA